MKRIVFLVFLFFASCTHKSGHESYVQSDIEMVHEARLRADFLEYICVLSPQQKDSVYDLILSSKKDVIALKSLKSITHDEYLVKRKELVTRRFGELRAIMSPEQNKKLDPYLATSKYFKDFW